MSKIVSLVPQRESGKTVEEMLKTVLEEYTALPKHHGFRKGMVILLDDTGDGFEPYYYSVGLNRPESVALLHILKTKFTMTLCQDEGW